MGLVTGSLAPGGCTVGPTEISRCYIVSFLQNAGADLLSLGLTSDKPELGKIGGSASADWR